MTHEQRLEAARTFRMNVLNERERLRGDLSALADNLSALSTVWMLLPVWIRNRLENYRTE